jgi:hypothetical protein
MAIAGYVSGCVQIFVLCFHCFTTCFGLHGHLQVCRIFYFLMLEGLCFAVFSHVVTFCTFPVLFSSVISVVSLRVCLSVSSVFVVCLFCLCNDWNRPKAIKSLESLIPEGDAQCQVFAASNQDSACQATYSVTTSGLKSLKYLSGFCPVLLVTSAINPRIEIGNVFQPK